MKNSTKCFKKARVQQHRLMAVAMGAAMLLQAGVAMAAPTAQQEAMFKASDPAVQLNRTREYLERARVAQQIVEDKEKAQSKVENTQSQEAAKPASVSFTLQQVEWDASQVLKEEELAAIAAKYYGDCSIEKLYQMVAEVNQLYAEKGYITCKAYLAPQTIKNGKVRVSIIEGRTGQVAVQGNGSTRENYIKGRIPLPQDGITSINKLNKDLLRFNATNDVQLRIALQAGQEPGTTDYIITAYEPKKETLTVYSDNSGSETSGEYRVGLFYNDRSLSGLRDSLSVSTIDSEGTRSLAAAYSYPVGHSGTKLRFQYSTNSVEITKGQLEPLGVRGHAHAVGVGVTQPLATSETMRSELTLDLNSQKSTTEFANMPWIEDTANSAALGWAGTTYGPSYILYRKINFTTGRFENIKEESKNFTRFNGHTMYQRVYGHGQQFNLRLDTQLAGNNYLPSSQQFYIGGAYSVRGYQESTLSGDRGYALGLEYSMPVLDDNTHAFIFLDHGKVGGDSAFDDNSLTGVGFGVKSTINKQYYASLTLGFPLEKELNGTQVDSSRLHFVVSGQF